MDGAVLVCGSLNQLVAESLYVLLAELLLLQVLNEVHLVLGLHALAPFHVHSVDQVSIFIQLEPQIVLFVSLLRQMIQVFILIPFLGKSSFPFNPVGLVYFDAGFGVD